jgi:hypothetical protein
MIYPGDEDTRRNRNIWEKTRVGKPSDLPDLPYRYEKCAHVDFPPDSMGVIVVDDD